MKEVWQSQERQRGDLNGWAMPSLVHQFLWLEQGNSTVLWRKDTLIPGLLISTSYQILFLGA